MTKISLKYFCVLSTLSIALLTSCKKESPAISADSTRSTATATTAQAPARPNVVYIGSKSVTTAWPFTVDTGYLSCDNHKLYFTAIGGALDGKQYAMNGEAMNEHRYPKIDEIWKKGDKTPNVNITEVFDRGMTICK